jgi:hypothetical protein
MLRGAGPLLVTLPPPQVWLRTSDRYTVEISFDGQRCWLGTFMWPELATHEGSTSRSPS